MACFQLALTSTSWSIHASSQLSALLQVAFNGPSDIHPLQIINRRVPNALAELVHRYGCRCVDLATLEHAQSTSPAAEKSPGRSERAVSLSEIAKSVNGLRRADGILSVTSSQACLRIDVLLAT